MVTVAEFLADFLSKNGVKRVYGIIGTSVLDFYDALYSRKDIRVITVRHEQSAVSAADAEFRAGGELSAALVHAGPGFLNTTISLGIAMKDRIPLLLISGGVKRRLRDTDAWLEVKQKAIADGLVKSYHVVENPGELASVLTDAFVEMLSYPYGPVAIEIPEDIWSEEVSGDVEDVRKTPANGISAEDVREVVDRLRRSERPLILACGELVRKSNFSQHILKKVAECFSAFVLTSGNGRGALP
ncbi:thiamine pyrophosphate-binding protein [Geoglobus sp.]